MEKVSGLKLQSCGVEYFQVVITNNSIYAATNPTD